MVCLGFLFFCFFFLTNLSSSIEFADQVLHFYFEVVALCCDVTSITELCSVYSLPPEIQGFQLRCILQTLCRKEVRSFTK